MLRDPGIPFELYLGNGRGKKGVGVGDEVGYEEMEVGRRRGGGRRIRRRRGERGRRRRRGRGRGRRRYSPGERVSRRRRRGSRRALITSAVFAPEKTIKGNYNFIYNNFKIRNVVFLARERRRKEEGVDQERRGAAFFSPQETQGIQVFTKITGNQGKLIFIHILEGGGKRKRRREGRTHIVEEVEDEEEGGVIDEVAHGHHDKGTLRCY